MDVLDKVQHEVKELKEAVTLRCEETEKAVDGFNTRLTELEQSHNSHVESTKKTVVINDIYSKRFNLLFHGIEDNNTVEFMWNS